mmetsp:Transcript_47855/g.144753  ORF Transcript_47855/g.144753 Transcript_47855/m.144753 type:complete len:88 (-) Transcript_47855:79-342(-)
MMLGEVASLSHGQRLLLWRDRTKANDFVTEGASSAWPLGHSEGLAFAQTALKAAENLDRFMELPTGFSGHTSLLESKICWILQSTQT